MSIREVTAALRAEAERLESEESRLRAALDELGQKSAELGARLGLDLEPPEPASLAEPIPPLWHQIALVDLGTPEGSPRILDYLRAASLPDNHPASGLWCAVALSAWLRWAGCEPVAHTMARAFLTYGTRVDQPQVGDLVVLWRDSLESEKGHVGLFVGFSGDAVQVLGGNQSDAVTVAPYPRDRILGFRRPA